MDLRDAASIISGKSTARDPNSNDLTVRVGVITALGSGTVSIKLGGDSTVIPNVRYLASYGPTVNDVVQVIVNGTALLVIGCTTATGWSSWSPVITQGVSVSWTPIYAQWKKDANGLVTAQGAWNITSTGTAGNQIYVNLPVNGITYNQIIGHFAVYSGGIWYTSTAYMNSVFSVGGLRDSTANFIGATPSLTLVAGNQVQFSVQYVAA